MKEKGRKPKRRRDKCERRRRLQLKVGHLSNEAVRSVLAHLEGAEHCGEDVQLHCLLPDALGLLDALGKVVQHLKPAHRGDT